MPLPFGIYNLMNPERYIWLQVRKTDKAILIDNGIKTWISKSRIFGIRLKNNAFEIHIEENMAG